MNFIKKLFKKERDPNQWEYCYNPEKSYYDDFSESYFIKRSSGEIIRIIAEDALDMVVFQDMGKTPKQIFEMGCKEHLFDELGAWDNDITVEDVKLWLDEFNKGNMDQAVREICDNHIEGMNRNADKYLSMKK